MIVSILEPPDLRRPRLAFAIAQVRRRQCRSLALLDATAPSASQWRSLQLAASPGMHRLDVVLAAGRCLQPVLDAVGSRSRDTVIDIDETESFAARGALVAAKVLVVAMTSTELDDSRWRLALRDRVERIRLFNPTLKVLLAPDDSCSLCADGRRDDLQRLAHSIGRAKPRNCSLGDLGRLRAVSQGSFDAGIECAMAALCAEIFADTRLPQQPIPMRLRSLCSRVDMAVAAGLRRLAIPAGRADIPPPFQ